MSHNLIARRSTGPLGRRITVRCTTHAEQSPDGDHETARDWVQRHAGVNATDAGQMVRDAGRWTS